ncbi:MAG: hypothetical protein ACK4QW_01160 [Alphaproteobacteria bacterium]
MQTELPDPEGFAAASAQATPDAVAETVSCGPWAERHLAAVRKDVDAGFDHIILVQVGPDQDYFLDLFRRELAPALRAGR